MKIRRIICFIAVLAVLFGTAAVAAAQMLNPYLPHNAPTALTPDPYNMDFYPTMSRTSYYPCPTCGLVSAKLLELPPMSQPIPGPFAIPVPVP